MRGVPLSRCVALQRAFDPANLATAEARINAAAAFLEGEINAQTLADLNNGQFAALIDFVDWKGEAVFLGSPIFDWLADGNLTLPPTELATYDKRGRGERDMWNLGNSE